MDPNAQQPTGHNPPGNPPAHPPADNSSGSEPPKPTPPPPRRNFGLNPQHTKPPVLVGAHEFGARPKPPEVPKSADVKPERAGLPHHDPNKTLTPLNPNIAEKETEVEAKPPANSEHAPGEATRSDLQLPD